MVRALWLGIFHMDHEEMLSHMRRPGLRNRRNLLPCPGKPLRLMEYPGWGVVRSDPSAWKWVKAGYTFRYDFLVLKIIRCCSSFTDCPSNDLIPMATNEMNGKSSIFQILINVFWNLHKRYLRDEWWMTHQRITCWITLECHGTSVHHILATPKRWSDVGGIEKLTLANAGHKKKIVLCDANVFSRDAFTLIHLRSGESANHTYAAVDTMVWNGPAERWT